MRIGILAPVASADVAHLLDDNAQCAHPGYPGAPFIATLIESLLQLGHEVVAFTSDRTLPRQSPPLSLEGPRFRLWLCPARPNGTLPRRGSPIGRIWDFFRQERQSLAKAVAQEPTDILHAHWTYEFAMVAADSGRPCLLTIHDAPGDILRLAPSLYSLGRYLMAKRVLRAGLPITAVSPYVAEIASRRRRTGIVPIIANPLPAWLKPTTPAIDHLPPSGVLIVAMVLGFWSGFKNPLPGIRAFVQIAKDFEAPLELHLYGPDFATGGKAERALRRAGISLHNIRLRGRVEHKRLLNELRCASVLLHTSRSESFGMAIAEAMALGVPVIAGHASGAIPWLLHDGKAGRLIDVSNVDDIARALRETIAPPGESQAKTSYALRSIWSISEPMAVARNYVDAYRGALE